MYLASGRKQRGRDWFCGRKFAFYAFCGYVDLSAGLLADLFHIAATHLVFTDLTMVFFGVSAPLERLREPLQQFIHDSILNGSPATEANIDSAVDRIMRDIQPDIDAIGVSLAF